MGTISMSKIGKMKTSRSMFTRNILLIKSLLSMNLRNILTTKVMQNGKINSLVEMTKILPNLIVRIP
jgi:hypothetical protein